ncbi:hypothetical protein HK102_013767 [Quaeritorhiza haematococci]|nr:hypothetical protein HK102_013767 [Quaeritorhiza haematococci]
MLSFLRSPPKHKDLERVVIVGASSGIGKALAVLYAKRGAQLLLIARREALLQSVTEECVKVWRSSVRGYQNHPTDQTTNNNVQYIVADATGEDDIARIVSKVNESFREGAVDTLILCAGIINVLPFADILNLDRSRSSGGPAISQQTSKAPHGGDHQPDVSTRIVEDIFRVNVLSPILCVKHFLNALVLAKGQVVVVSSVAGVIGAPTRSLYASTKFALNGFFNSLRVELESKGVGVCVIMPATVDTDLRASAVDLERPSSDASGKPAPPATASSLKKLSPLKCAAAIISAADRRQPLQVALSFPQPRSQSPPEILYPEVRRDNVSDDYFGKIVADPYRYLEDPFSADTLDFMRNQNELTETYTDLLAYDRWGSPFKRGDYYYYFANLGGLNNHSSIYRTRNLFDSDANAQLFLDPVKLPENLDQIDVTDGYNFSPDNKYFAFIMTKTETDYGWIGVLNVTTGERLPDELRYALRRSSDIEWAKDGSGFVYYRFDAPQNLTWDEAGRNNDLIASTIKRFFHRFGDSQSEDVRCDDDEGETIEPLCNSTVLDKGEPDVAGPASSEPRFAKIFLDGTLAGPDDRRDESQTLLIKLPSRKTKSRFLPYQQLLDDMDGMPEIPPFAAEDDPFDTSFIGQGPGGVFYYQTAAGASNYRVIGVKPSQQDEDGVVDAVTVIPESTLILDKAYPVADGVFLSLYLDDARHVIRVNANDTENTIIQEFEDLRGGACTDVQPMPDLNIVAFRWSSPVDPGAIYIYNATSNQLLTWRTMKLPINNVPDLVRTELVKYVSKDNITVVPMTIVAPRQFVPSRTEPKNVPVWLTGYGGFGITRLPSFSSFALALSIHFDAVYGLVHIRGGKEYGMKWWVDGRNLRKQNCFDDTIWAAKHLIKEGWTQEGL